MDENIQNNFSTKQILMILFCASILLGFTYFYFFSALKQSSYYFIWNFFFFYRKTFRRVHSIRTLQINLIDLRLQFIFLPPLSYSSNSWSSVKYFLSHISQGTWKRRHLWYLVAIFLFGKHRLKSPRIGVKTTIFILGLRAFFNLKVYFDAKRRLPEFSGLQGRRYPGQPAPLPYIVTPRRPHPPPGHQH